MSKSYFVFIYPERGRIKSNLDLAIFLLNPREKWPAHITVAGPFRRRSLFQIRRNDFRDMIFCMGCGSFLPRRATVYLKVGSPRLLHEGVWNKPDFRGKQIPHLTLYDGSDFDFAGRVFSMVKELNPYFSFSVKGLHTVESISGQFRSDLINELDFSIMDEISSLNIDSVAKLDSEYRLELSEKALRGAFSAAQ